MNTDQTNKREPRLLSRCNLHIKKKAATSIAPANSFIPVLEPFTFRTGINSTPPSLTLIVFMPRLQQQRPVSGEEMSMLEGLMPRCSTDCPWRNSMPLPACSSHLMRYQSEGGALE